MAYFRENETEETRRQPAVNVPPETDGDEAGGYIESDYDDGFDDPADETEEEISGEERKEIRRQRIRLASGAGNLAAVIAGTLLILILLAFLLNMVGFVLNDADRNFTLFQTRF